MTFKRLASAIALAAMMLASTGKANGQTPRPEYPRPQFERSEWMNLNGTWTDSFDFGKTGEQKGWKNSKGFDGQCPSVQKVRSRVYTTPTSSTASGISVNLISRQFGVERK